MKPWIVLALAVVIALGGFAVWFTLGSSSSSSEEPSVPSALVAQADSTLGGTVEQVIQKIIPKPSLAPEIASSIWLNSPALSTQDLRGHVVVVEFWTFG
jgi:hypothetical protein